MAKNKKFKDGFSISELFSNSSGKTSGSGVAGFLTVLVGLLCFISGVVYIYLSCWHACEPTQGSHILTQSIALIGIGSALLGVRKIAKDKGITEVDVEIEEQGEKEDKEEMLND